MLKFIFHTLIWSLNEDVETYNLFHVVTFITLLLFEMCVLLVVFIWLATLKLQLVDLQLIYLSVTSQKVSRWLQIYYDALQCVSVWPEAVLKYFLSNLENMNIFKFNLNKTIW